MSAFKRLICVLLAAAALCSTLASCSDGHGVVSDDSSYTSVFDSESPSERPSPSGDTSGVVDLPWEILLIKIEVFESRVNGNSHAL